MLSNNHPTHVRQQDSAMNTLDVKTFGPNARAKNRMIGKNDTAVVMLEGDTGK